MYRLNENEQARLKRNASRWTMIQYEEVTIKTLAHEIRVTIHSGSYEGDVFTSDGRVRETDDGNNEPYLLFKSVVRPENYRRLMLDY